MLYTTLMCPVCTSINPIVDSIEKETISKNEENTTVILARTVHCHCDDCGAKFTQDEIFTLDHLENVIIDSEFEDDFVEEVKEEN